MIYAYVTMNINDPKSLAAYGEKAGVALAKHGGALVSLARETTSLEGNPTKQHVVALLSFTDKAAALSWRQDPDLAHVHGLRESSGETAILLLG